MTLATRPATPTQTRHGATLKRLGLMGLIGAVVLTVVAYLVVGNVFDRLEDSLEISSETVITVDQTLDVASRSLTALDAALETVVTATELAANTSETVAGAVGQAVQIIGTDLPASIDAVRTAMPGLIDASRVIHTTLSGLAFFGVPYNPDTPLDQAFVELDNQLSTLPESLRDNALLLSGLVPEIGGFRIQTGLLKNQVSEIQAAVTDAGVIITSYQEQTDRFDEVIQGTRDDLGRSALMVRLLVILAGVLAAVVTIGLMLTGRAISNLETT